jgi:hypothetical protein
MRLECVPGTLALRVGHHVGRQLSGEKVKERRKAKRSYAGGMKHIKALNRAIIRSELGVQGHMYTQY